MNRFLKNELVILANSGLYYFMRSPLWITIILLFVSSRLAYGQKTAALSGVVTDAATGKPMPFANVYMNGSTQGAVSDENGAYTLDGIPLGTVEVVASFVGYQPATQKIRFENATPQKANFQLKPSEQMLDAVTVRGNARHSEKLLRQFKKQLFGEPFGGQCLLVNSNALHFKEDKGHLYAMATEPLIIENQALGYRVMYDLQHFDATSTKTYSAGTARFEELKPENEKQADRFRRNRLTAYKGSIRHLMASLIDNTFEQAGFLVYQEDLTKAVSTELRALTLASAISDFKRLIPVQTAKLIQPGKLPTERRLVSPMKLVIFYTKANSTFSPYPDARFAYTEMKLPSGQLQMTVDGMITIPEGMEAQGSMGNEGLSSMLPADWKATGTEKEALSNAPVASQGKIAAPDASLGRIVTAFEERFKVLAPTLFVHIDKPFYVTGDRLWMSTYLLDAATHQRPGGETAIHVDLLTSRGKPVDHQWVRITDGRGQGHFRLPDTLATGTYRLRAYTDEDDAQRGPAFERTVAIYNFVRNGTALENDSNAQLLDIQFLPEGGRWISGLPALLGVKIVQPDGRGLSIEGRIVDDLGVEIVRFKTSQQGMTSIFMQPKAERTYYADVNYKNQPHHILLPKPEKEGLLLSADATSDTTRTTLTVTSSDRLAADSAYILVQQRNRVVDQQKIILQNGVAKFSLPTTSWLPGLAQITLYDAAARPQAERLIFVPGSVAPVRVVLGFNKTKYQPREHAVVSIKLNDNGSPAPAALSASVTDIGKVPEDTAEASLQAHLLLTGELRGRVENANQYVIDRSPETRRALDDLLLTQGWRRVSGTPEADSLGGVSFRGRVLNAKNQPISNAQLTVASTRAGQAFVKTSGADEEGRFRLAGLNMTDTLQLMAQVADRHSKKLSAKDVVLVLERPGQRWEYGKIVTAPNWPALQAQLDAAKTRQEANTELYRDKTATALDEVTVRGKKSDVRPDDIQMRSLHNAADAVFIFDEKSPAYANLYEMIQGRFAGVTVAKAVIVPGKPVGYKVSVRGENSFKSGTQPLFLMDGLPIQDPDGTALLYFNSRDIERVEVLKNAGTAGIYGVLGGNGVIAFYTKSAGSMQVGGNPREVMIPVQFIGYPSVQREFYVPRYDAETATNPISGPIDDRDVLYWKPLIQTDIQGNTQLRFPLSDVVRTLRVVVQGITAEGRPVLGVQLVQVQ